MAFLLLPLRSHNSSSNSSSSMRHNNSSSLEASPLRRPRSYAIRYVCVVHRMRWYCYGTVIEQAVEKLQFVGL